MASLFRNRSKTGFTLVELLVVIAIIAILVAIIFPVFARVRENGRQASTLSHFSEIARGLNAYKLDHNNKFPPVLFGYAVAGTNMGDGEAAAAANSTAHEYFPGLYPTYINDVTVFQDANNTVKPNDTATVTLNANTLNPSGILVPLQPAPSFYSADAVDVSPFITSSSNNTIDYTRMVPRYQVAWTSLAKSLDVVDANGRDNYRRQLVNPTATGDIYVTCVTHHVQNYGKVLVLWWGNGGGYAKTLDTSRFLINGPDTADISATGNPPVSPATFWKVTQSGN